MTLSEFKAWFEGFTESMDGAPSEKQFKRIKAKVAEITGTPITQTVFVDRYRPYYETIWRNGPVWTGGLGGGPYGVSGGNIAYAQAVGTLNNKSSDAAFDSHSAMYSVGRADALSEAA